LALAFLNDIEMPSWNESRREIQQFETNDVTKLTAPAEEKSVRREEQMVRGD
jgi:hypothetical protein